MPKLQQPVVIYDDLRIMQLNKSLFSVSPLTVHLNGNDRYHEMVKNEPRLTCNRKNDGFFERTSFHRMLAVTWNWKDQSQLMAKKWEFYFDE